MDRWAKCVAKQGDNVEKYDTNNFYKYSCKKGRAVAEWLRHYATNRQVAGSIADGVIGIFQ